MTQITPTGKKSFITGGAGFIASTLIERLIEDNEMTAYDNFRRDALSAESYSSHPNLRIVKGDALDYPALDRAMEGSQYVVHCTIELRRISRMAKPSVSERK